jgi:N-acetyl-gamma-glutamylphosphate reductase
VGWVSQCARHRDTATPDWLRIGGFLFLFGGFFEFGGLFGQQPLVAGEVFAFAVDDAAAQFFAGTVEGGLVDAGCVGFGEDVAVGGGAGGRTEDIGFTFTNTYENFRAYKILTHQHTPEIEEYGGYAMKKKLPKIIFTPHLLPVYRGILSTFVIQFDNKIDSTAVTSQFSKFSSEPFIRIYKKPEEIELKNIQNSNFLDLSFRVEDNILVIVSALDNLVKGAAGQALQNINLMFGLDERKGLLANV